jgi:hypothetical protein
MIVLLRMNEARLRNPSLLFLETMASPTGVIAAAELDNRRIFYELSSSNRRLQLSCRCCLIDIMDSSPIPHRNYHHD